MPSLYFLHPLFYISNKLQKVVEVTLIAFVQSSSKGAYYIGHVRVSPNSNVTHCDLTTRRSFIEHCTTVHNMKFRTKSGATISAPTVLQKSAQAAAVAAAAQAAQAAKRKADIQPVIYQPKILKRLSFPN